MNTSMVLDDIVEVPASKLWHKTIEIPSTLEGVKLAGWCVASGGARNDIKVLVLNDVDFYNWKNFGKVKGLYQSDKISVAEMSAEITAPGRYHLVITNWFSEFSTKEVIAKVYLYWSVKPVTYTIKANDPALNSEDFKIPSSSDVTFEFADKVDTSNFRVSKDGKETPVSANISGTKVEFSAPSVGVYEFTCGDSANMVKASFSIIPAQPMIGQGLTVSSTMANSPPSLNKIGNREYDHRLSFDSFTIGATDPDDDLLTYYAFNLPAASAGYDENGQRIWQPAAELDKNSGAFSWNKAASNLPTGTYFVRIEVTDGILSDYEDISIDIK